MKHYGDITKLNGHELPIVDIITGGSPCQDLSIAGKRAGLDGERSGLFMEQIRVIKEIREYDKSTGRPDEHIRPRYMVWENVAGAFSSNKGEDFRVVLEETAKIADENAVIPGLEGGDDGQKPDASWETDIQSLGECMMPSFGEYLKEESAYVYLLTSTETPHQRYYLNCSQKPLTETSSKLSDILETSPDPKYNLSPKACQGILNRAKKRGKKLPELLEKTLIQQSMMSESAVTAQRTGEHMPTKPTSAEILTQGGATQTVTTEDSQSSCLNSWDVQSKHIQPENGIAESLYSGECRYGGGESYVMCLNDQGGQQMEVTENITGTLRAQEHGHQPIVYGISSYDSNAMKSSNPYSGIYEAQTTRTLDNNGGNPACNQGGMVVVEPIPINTMVATRETDEKRTTFGVGNEGDPQFTISANHEHAVFCIEGNGSRESHKGDGYKESETMYTLNTVEQHAVCYAMQRSDERIESDVTSTQSARQYKDATDLVVYGLDRASFNQGQNAQFDFSVEEEKAQTLVSKGRGGVLAKR